MKTARLLPDAPRLRCAPLLLCAVLGLPGCGGSAPGPDVGPGPGPDPIVDLRAQLEALASKKIYFGHNSVGGEILGDDWVPFTPTPAGSRWGIVKLLADHPGTGVTVKKVGQAASFTPGTLAGGYVGTNYQPLTKAPAFDAVMRGGTVPAPDIAFMKYCYVDWSASTDVNAVFAQYQATLAALERDFPTTIFAHVTVPLTTAAAPAYECDANASREAFSALIRQTYPAGRVFDLAALEATGPTGAPATCTSGGKTRPALAAAWAAGGNDVGHVGQAGADMLAAELVGFLANLR